MARGIVCGGVIVAAVVAQPLKIRARDLILAHVVAQRAALPKGVVDLDRGGERLGAVRFERFVRTGGGRKREYDLARRIRAAGDGVVHLLAVRLDAGGERLRQRAGGGGGEGLGVVQRDRVLAAREHIANQTVDGGGVLGRRRERRACRRFDKACERRVFDGAIRRDRPRERQARFGLDHARQKRRDLRAADAAVGIKAALCVHAGEQPAAVHQQNFAAVGRFVRHVGNVLAARVGRGDERGVGLGVPFLRHGEGKDARHLRARRGQEVEALEAVVEQILALQVRDIRRVPRLILLCGGDDRVAAGRVDGAQPRGDGQKLGDRHIAVRRKGTLTAAVQKPVFIGRDDRGGEPVAVLHVGKLALVDAKKHERGAVVCRRFLLCRSGNVLRGLITVSKGADAQRKCERRNKQRKAELHGVCSLFLTFSKFHGDHGTKMFCSSAVMSAT